jgi:hypothetical protein
MKKYRITLDKREDGKTVESIILPETEHYIGVLFDYNKDNLMIVDGRTQICGVFDERGIYDYAHICADILTELTKGKDNEALIWSKFLQTIVDQLNEHAGKRQKEKEDELRGKLREKGCPDEEIEKVLDMLNEAAHEGAEAIRASIRDDHAEDQKMEAKGD